MILTDVPRNGYFAGSQLKFAYEKETNHGGTGKNIVFADGSVRWMLIADARLAIQVGQAIRSLAARGFRPFSVAGA